MTPAEIAELVGTRRVARAGGSCYFTTYTPSVAQEWRERGASVKTDNPDGQFVAEIHLWALLDEPTERDEEGRLIDNRREILMSFYRERDGYGAPRRDGAA